MSNSVTVKQSKGVRVVGLLTLIAGIVLIIAGGITWWKVSDELSAEQITVSDDASFLAGRHVNDPFSAYAQAEVINKHALEATDGMTYAELAQDDPRRVIVMNASFLRASLFTSVVSFGVAALVMGLGVLFILVGWALRRLASGPDVASATAGGAGTPGAHAYDDTPAAPAPRHQSPPTAPSTSPGTTPRVATDRGTSGAAGSASAAAAGAAAAAAAATSSGAPSSAPNSTPGTTATPSTTPGNAPAGTAPAGTPTTTPGSTPTAAPGATPTTTPGSAPSTTPDSTPTTTPQETPGNPSATQESSPTDERPTGWASPADRVPPVDGTPEGTDTK